MKNYKIGNMFTHWMFGGATARLIAINGKTGVFDTSDFVRIEGLRLDDSNLKKVKKKKWMR